MSSNMTVMDYDTNYDYSGIQKEAVKVIFVNNIQMLYIVTYLIACCLGSILNFYVIIASCCVYHKLQKPPVSVWILALAVTHLVFSGFLVLQLLQAWHEFTWWYGVFLCKLSSYIFFASMFSTAAMLSLWSIRCCIGTNRCSKWLRAACCGKGTSMDIIFVLISWTLAAILSSPSLLSRELRDTKMGQQCIDDYDLNKEMTTHHGKQRLIVVVLSRFLLGILVPMLVMGICACLSKRQRHHIDSTCKRVTCAIKVAYFVCWTPLLFMSLIHATTENLPLITYEFPVANVLAAAHGLINPVIYLLVGCKLNMHWMSQVSICRSVPNFERVEMK